MTFPTLTPRMMMVLSWIAVFATMAPATVMTAAPTVIWLEGVAADGGPGLGSWLILALASLVAVIGLLAYILIWGWPLAVIFLAVRAIRALRRPFPRVKQKSAHKEEDWPVRERQHTKRAERALKRALRDGGKHFLRAGDTRCRLLDENLTEHLRYARQALFSGLLSRNSVGRDRQGPLLLSREFT